MKWKQTGIWLSTKDRAELERIAADGNERQKIVKRARIVLLTAQGHGVMAIMRALGVSKTTVWRWQDYFVEAGVAGLVKGRSNYISIRRLRGSQQPVSESEPIGNGSAPPLARLWPLRSGLSPSGKWQLQLRATFW